MRAIRATMSRTILGEISKAFGGCVWVWFKVGLRWVFALGFCAGVWLVCCLAGLLRFGNDLGFGVVWGCVLFGCVSIIVVVIIRGHIREEVMKCQKLCLFRSVLIFQNR